MSMRASIVNFKGITGTAFFKNGERKPIIISDDDGKLVLNGASAGNLASIEQSNVGGIADITTGLSVDYLWIKEVTGNSIVQINHAKEGVRIDELKDNAKLLLSDSSADVGQILGEDATIELRGDKYRCTVNSSATFNLIQSATPDGKESSSPVKMHCRNFCVLG